MRHIQVLSDDVISKIAAGEVIERPASVLKELLENSIDAGASKIEISIKKAGRDLIRVYDDGQGMGREDLKLSVLRHSTSKIKDFDDLYSLATYGFRGEALYSIFAVSKMKIISYQAGAEAAYMLEGEGGIIKTEQPAPPAKGTIIEVANLFFNIPARAKFLKSDASERAHIIKTAEEAALSNCGTALRLVIDDVEIFSVPLLQGGFKPNLQARAETVLGKKIFSGMKEINFNGEGISVFGFVSDMSSFSATRANQYYFVNRRPVASQLLKQALYKAYPNIPVGKHPACVLFVELEPKEFDVNVHPQKRDVKFTQESEIFRAIGHAVRAAVENHTSVPSFIQNSPRDAVYTERAVFGSGIPLAKQDIPLVGEQNNLEQNMFAFDAVGNVLAEDKNIQFEQVALGINGIALGAKNIQPAQASGRDWQTQELAYIGQLAQSYLIFECARGLLIVDQHAAQERVFFERYLEQFADKKIDKQPLLVPVEAELSLSQTENVLRWKDWLESAGFEIDARGPNFILLRSAPALFNFGQKSFTEFLSYLADIMGNPSRVAEDVKRNIVATMACKKAVKARDVLNSAEAKAIMQSLRACRDGAHCPHGRPTMFYITGIELARKFDRNAAL